MATKRTINVNGQDLEVIDVGFEATKPEGWNEYELADGGRVRIKMTVIRILQVLDAEGKPAKNPDGDRFLIVQSNNQLVIQD